MNYFYSKISKVFSVAGFLVIFCLQGCLYAESAKVDESLTGQLKINYWTLLNSTDEQIRVDTAAELLKDPSGETRSTLVDLLLSKDNAVVQGSICKAISRFRSFPDLIPKREDFIDPLMSIIRVGDIDIARLAARASLIFTYSQVRKPLDSILNDSGIDSKAKKNAICALKVRPDREAVLRLIELYDSNDEILSSLAGVALQEWLPLGKNKQLTQEAIKELKARSRMDILRDRLMAQEARMYQQNDEVSRWQKRYIASLDIIYQATTEDNARAKFIADSLVFEHSSVRLWAVEKINMWRNSGKPLPLDVLQKPLVFLVSDVDSEVRLASVKLLGILTSVNSADALFAQLQVETNPEVKAEILVSLGHVCNFALSPGAEIEIDPQIRIETLKIVSAYLMEKNPGAAAEVIRNMLLQNGLNASEVKPYFELMASNFRKSRDEQVQVRLLDEMSRLCGNDSFYRGIAGDIFGGIFMQAIDSTSNQIATPAVVGLVRINESDAFELLKDKNFTRHPSVRIRGELISVASQIGTTDDLDWLGEILTTSESEDEKRQAVEAMMSVFQHSKAEVMLLWAEKLSQYSTAKNDELLLARAQTLFESAEKKAEVEQDTKLLFSIRYSMAQHYADANLYGLAAKYYGVVLQSVTDPNYASEITAKILAVQLRSGQIESVKQLASNILLSSDIVPGSAASKAINGYFTANHAPETAIQIIIALDSIKVSENTPRPEWKKQVNRWKKLLNIQTTETVAEPNSTVEKK